jgi:hemoglobin
MSLFERLGGEAAIDKAVNIFYSKVKADDSINYFFEHTDMERQAKKQKAFLTYAFGGPNNYTGKNMRHAHKHLVEKGLNDEHFDAVVGHLAGTLIELGASEDDIKEVAGIAESVRDDVLNR